MKPHRSVALLFCGVAAVLPTAARAGDGRAAVAPTAAPDGSGLDAAIPVEMQLGVSFVPASVDSVSPRGTSPAVAANRAAIGFMTAFDLLLRPNVFVGVAPGARYFVAGPASTTRSPARPSNEFDLRLRLGMRARIGDRSHLYGYLSPGYSIASWLPVGTVLGPVVGLHGGARRDVGRAVFLTIEIGYDVSLQRGAVDRTDASVRRGSLQLAMGAGVRFP